MMCSKAFLIFIIIIKQEKRKVVPRCDWTPLYTFLMNSLEQNGYKENVNHPQSGQYSTGKLKYQGKDGETNPLYVSLLVTKIVYGCTDPNDIYQDQNNFYTQQEPPKDFSKVNANQKKYNLEHTHQKNIGIAS